MSSRIIKFEIMLEAREPGEHGYKVGERVKLTNEIFDRQNGVAFWEIESTFDILWRREFTGLHLKEKEIYEGDVFLLDGEHILVYWNSEKASFRLNGDDDYDFDNKGRPLSQTWLEKYDIELVGNIYEDESLKNRFNL